MLRDGLPLEPQEPLFLRAFAPSRNLTRDSELTANRGSQSRASVCRTSLGRLLAKRRGGTIPPRGPRARQGWG